MNMLKQAIYLWKKERRQKGSTLQRRLILFFAFLIISVILLFTLLLTLFGITGSGRQEVYRYMESELLHISRAVDDDFGNLSVTGVALAQSLSETGDSFFKENDLSAENLSAHPEYIESLLAEQMPAVLYTANNNACGGVFVVLDAAMNPAAGDADSKRAGLFIKKTQPVSSVPLTAKGYLLRGPASVAREYGVNLIGQWQMEYDFSELAFFDSVMDTARENPDLPLSRLYCWTDRLCLNGNSEEGILLCVPLRSADGAVYGVCGIEVSDRMFKQLYSPNESTYQGVFAIAAPIDSSALHAECGLMAGNSYLTGSQINESLAMAGEEKGFSWFSGKEDTYGSLYGKIKLYPTGSPYADEEWVLAVLMPRLLLSEAIKGSSAYLFLIVGGLLVISLIACVIISRRYLRPIKEGLSSIREKAYKTEEAVFGVAEIDSLFEELARDVREHREEVSRLVREKQDVQGEMESLQEEHKKAQSEIARLAYSRKNEIDPDNFRLFLESLHTLTSTERIIFEYYLAGKSAKEIMALMDIKENTLKYHNRNIYDKLGVTSRKELLRYAVFMKQEQGGDGAK